MYRTVLEKCSAMLTIAQVLHRPWNLKGVGDDTYFTSPVSTGGGFAGVADIIKAQQQRSFLAAAQVYCSQLKGHTGPSRCPATSDSLVHASAAGCIDRQGSPPPSQPLDLEDIAEVCRQLQMSPASLSSIFLEAIAPDLRFAERSMAALDARFAPCR